MISSVHLFSHPFHLHLLVPGLRHRWLFIENLIHRKPKKMTAFCFLVPTTNPFALVRVRWFGLRVRSSALCLSISRIVGSWERSVCLPPLAFRLCFTCALHLVVLELDFFAFSRRLTRCFMPRPRIFWLFPLKQKIMQSTHSLQMIKKTHGILWFFFFPFFLIIFSIIFPHLVVLEFLFLFLDSGLWNSDKLCIHCLFTNRIMNGAEEKNKRNNIDA